MASCMFLVDTARRMEMQQDCIVIQAVYQVQQMPANMRQMFLPCTRTVSFLKSLRTYRIFPLLLDSEQRSINGTLISAIIMVSTVLILVCKILSTIRSLQFLA